MISSSSENSKTNFRRRLCQEKRKHIWLRKTKPERFSPRPTENSSKLAIPATCPEIIQTRISPVSFKVKKYLFLGISENL
jgi:hypothetical protein